MIVVEVVVEMVVMKCHELDVVFDGTFGGVGDEEVVVGEGVVEEALVEFIVELCEEDEDGRKNEKDSLFNLKANDQSRKA
ncbi:hypothetical protein Tco_0597151 [Tanacetum coccineum]